MEKYQSKLAKFDRRPSVSATGNGRLGSQVGRENVASRLRGVESPREGFCAVSAMMTSIAISGRDALVVPKQSTEPIDTIEASRRCANFCTRLDDAIADSLVATFGSGRELDVLTRCALERANTEEDQFARTMGIYGLHEALAHIVRSRALCGDLDQFDSRVTNPLLELRRHASESNDVDFIARRRFSGGVHTKLYCARNESARFLDDH